MVLLKNLLKVVFLISIIYFISQYFDEKFIYENEKHIENQVNRDASIQAFKKDNLSYRLIASLKNKDNLITSTFLSPLPNKYFPDFKITDEYPNAFHQVDLFVDSEHIHSYIFKSNCETRQYELLIPKNKDDYVIDKSGEMNEGVYFVLCENDYFKELIFAKVEIIRIKKNEKLKLEILQNKKVM